jgi:hypothetical protein
LAVDQRRLWADPERAFSKAIVLLAWPGEEIVENSACAAGLVGTSSVVLMTGLSWASAE